MLLAGAPADYAASAELGSGFVALVEAIAASPGVRTVCEVGGGRRPMLSLESVERCGLDYTVLDISSEQLALAPDGYRKVLADIGGPSPPEVPGMDLVFSRMVAEHVRDARRFHRNVFALLAPGGLAVHAFPTLYSPPFVINRLVPEAIAGRLLEAVLRERRAFKFPAYYRWCRGPTDRQRERFERLGYEVVAYRGFFGTRYLRNHRWLGEAERRAGTWMLEHPNPLLTSYAWVVLRRPPGSGVPPATEV